MFTDISEERADSLFRVNIIYPEDGRSMFPESLLLTYPRQQYGTYFDAPVHLL
jgi:hypothetical protein